MPRLKTTLIHSLNTHLLSRCKMIYLLCYTICNYTCLHQTTSSMYLEISLLVHITIQLGFHISIHHVSFRKWKSSLHCCYLYAINHHSHTSNWQHNGPHVTTTRVRILAWAYLKGASSLTSLHYLWRSPSPFSLQWGQEWPYKSVIITSFKW